MIRLAEIQDLKQIMDVITSAKLQLKEAGLTQWNLEDGYPDATNIIEDIVKEQMYVSVDMVKQVINGCAVLCKDLDNDYEKQNFWSNNEPYISIHRLAVLKDYLGQGIASSLIKHCIDKTDTINIRIDTHELNKPMIALINKLNFEYKGIITLERLDKDNLRNAYELVKSQ